LENAIQLNLDNEAMDLLNEASLIREI